MRDCVALEELIVLVIVVIGMIARWIVLLQFSCVLGSRAPDTAPNLPDGWCDTHYGTPTRSTGECICKYACLGNGCRREHGLNWYEYKSCPSCKCVAGEKSKQSATSVKSEPITETSSAPDEVPEEEMIDETTFLDLLEENSRYIFAGVVTFVVFSFAIYLLFGINRNV